jgi:hypothetical protein
MTRVVKKVFLLLSSQKLTVTCLLLMIVLVIWGTIYEASQGVYAARERFFQSWIFWTGIKLPFPGLRLIAVVLILNLLPGLIRFARRPVKNSGLLFIHFGIVSLMSGVFFSSYFVHEYFLPLYEGETSGSAYNYQTSEIAVYKSADLQSRTFYTSDSIVVQNIKSGQKLTFPNAGIEFEVAGFKEEKDPEHKDEKIPVFHITLLPENSCISQDKEIILKSGDQPSGVLCNGQMLYLSIRPVSVPLPASLKLVNFSKQFHPGTQMLKEVRSQVKVKSKDLERDAVISMNKPLRYGSFTFYQASYSQQDGKAVSNISVVYNPMRIFPYVISLIIVAGFLLHLCLTALRKANEQKQGNNNAA